MDWSDLGSMLMGAVVSGAVGWLFAFSSSRRVAQTHEKLTLLVKALEAERVVTFRYDDKGKPVGVVLQASGTSRGTSSATASLSVVKAPEQQAIAPSEDR